MTGETKMKPTLNQLAKHHGVSVSAVKKWSKAKQAAHIRDMQAGVLPHITALVGELAGACYRASCHVGRNVQLESHFSKEMPFFCVYYRKPGESELTYLIENCTELSTVWLCAAIAKVEELCK
jgi:hypothetical protein